MDKAQWMSLARHALTAIGAAVAGSALYPYISFLFEPGYIEIIAGLIVAGLGALLGNLSNTPQALVTKLIENPNVPNDTAAAAIKNNAPEMVAK